MRWTCTHRKVYLARVREEYGKAIKRGKTCMLNEAQSDAVTQKEQYLKLIVEAALPLRIGRPR